MKNEKFEKLLKENTPKKIIFLYTHKDLYLTDKQLQKVIDLKNGELK